MNRRREIADRVVARWRAHGIDLDADPNYVHLVDLWIEGTIAASEMRRRYLIVLREQELDRAARFARAVSAPLRSTERNPGIEDASPDGSAVYLNDPVPFPSTDD